MIKPEEILSLSEELANIADQLETGPSDEHRMLDLLMFMDDLSDMFHNIQMPEAAQDSIGHIVSELRQARGILNRQIK